MKDKNGIVKVLCFAALLLAGCFNGYGQTIIKNPEKPQAANAGRMLKLQEVWRITDESGQFFFKYPSQLQIAGDGSIFLSDEEQFLRFTSDGKFVKNLYKKGEGPGEISRGLTYFIRGDELIIRDFNKRKAWSTDYEGHLLREFEIPNTGYTGFIGIRKNDFVFTKTVTPPPGRTYGQADGDSAERILDLDGWEERTEDYDVLFQPIHVTKSRAKLDSRDHRAEPRWKIYRRLP